MKFLLLNTDYAEFLRWLYAQHPGLERQPYAEQMRARNESLFGVADFYSRNLRKLGHEAYDIHTNNEYMQRAWSREHGVRMKELAILSPRWRETLQQARRVGAKTPLRYLKPLFRPVLRSLDGFPSWFYEVLTAQIKHYKPDVVLNHDLGSISSHFLKEMKPYVRLLVGQIASPLPQREDFRCYNLVISSLPNFVTHFRKLGIPSELNRFAFEPRVLEKLDEDDKVTLPLSFVGSLSPAHKGRARLLEYLCAQLPLKVWGQRIENLAKDSPLRQHHMGKAWGIEMYQILRNSKITLNHHISVAESYANNMRLFEATGVGTLLITDWKENLREMFAPGKEVLAYRSPKECLEFIQYYLERDGEREAIARAGQERTLQEHTYFQRMQELVEIIQRFL